MSKKEKEIKFYKIPLPIPTQSNAKTLGMEGGRNGVSIGTSLITNSINPESAIELNRFAVFAIS